MNKNSNNQQGGNLGGQAPVKRSIDGFTRARSIDGFKPINRSAGLQRTSELKPNPKVSEFEQAAKAHAQASEDVFASLIAKEDSFPGLNGTYQNIGFKGATDFNEPSTGNSRFSGLKPGRPSLFGAISLFRPKRILAAVMVLVLVGGGWFGLRGFLAVKGVFRGDGSEAIVLNNKIDPSLLNGEGDGRVNVLLLGKGGDTHEGGDLTDSITVASLDPINNKANLLSIPRDLYVDVDDFWPMKINAAHITAKQKSLSQGVNEEQADQDASKVVMETVETYIGIPIHFAILIDFKVFEDAVDALGGVTIDVKDKLYDENFLPTFLLNIKPGLQTLDGPTALFYVRSRYTSPRGDFDRAQRQREVLVALRENALSAGTFTNPLKLNNLLSAVQDNVQTNMSLDIGKQLFEISSKLQPEQIKSLSFVDDPALVTTSFIGDQSVVIPIGGVNNYQDIRDFVRTQLRDGFLERENASVDVLNGSSTPGLATSKARELTGYGYNIDRIANADQLTYPQTVIYDLSDGDNPYTAAYLSKRFRASVDSKVPDSIRAQSNSDFVIITGSNEKVFN